MSLPPFDGTGWITGMPGLPGGTVEATGATAGTPGTWTPAGSIPPDSLAETIADGVVASPATAWTTGQRVVTGDAALIHWDGAAWVTGAAVLSEDELGGWTVVELKQFAADHEPPIEVPSGATKAQIIALILAAIQAESEEN